MECEHLPKRSGIVNVIGHLCGTVPTAHKLSIPFGILNAKYKVVLFQAFFTLFIRLMLNLLRGLAARRCLAKQAFFKPNDVSQKCFLLQSRLFQTQMTSRKYASFSARHWSRNY